MKNCKRLTGPRLANKPDRLVSRSLKTKSRPHLQLIHGRASSLLFVASDMQQELLHRVLHTNALKRSSLLPANPHMGLNCSKEKETPQLHLFAAMNHDRPPQEGSLMEKVLKQQTAKPFQRLSQSTDSHLVLLKGSVVA